MLTSSIALMLAAISIMGIAEFITVDGQQQLQSRQENTATTFESMTDGYRLQIPNGWTGQYANYTEMSRLYGLGIETVVTLCPQEKADAAAGAKQMCESSYNPYYNPYEPFGEIYTSDSVEIFRLDLTNRSTFDALPQTSNITVSDFLGVIIEIIGGGVFELLNDTDMTVNFTDPHTNETIATIPAKLVEYTTETRETYVPISVRSFDLLTVNDNTGYWLTYRNETSSLPSGRAPSPVQQIFDSFELVRSGTH